MNNFMQRLAAVTLACLSISAFAQPNSPDGLTYKTSLNSIMALGREIYGQLEPKARATISPQPISVETDMMPYVRLQFQQYPDDPKPIRGVWISAGFIDLVNMVAHARSIDQLVQKGYFEKYITALAQETGEKELRPLPNDDNPKFWTEEVLEDQKSNFNSIVGIVVGVKLAHHYLGQYDKYKDKLTDASGKPVPINNLLTPKEWDDAFQKGVYNSLSAGCLIEGAIPFFESFDKMQNRPPWVAYFLPEAVKFSKLKKDLKKIQDRFFAGN